MDLSWSVYRTTEVLRLRWGESTSIARKLPILLKRR